MTNANANTNTNANSATATASCRNDLRGRWTGSIYDSKAIDGIRAWQLAKPATKIVGCIAVPEVDMCQPPPWSRADMFRRAML